MTMQDRRRAGYRYALHDWLVVGLVAVFVVGEPAILNAAGPIKVQPIKVDVTDPCDECEKTKATELAKCAATHNLEKKNCVTDANASAAKCVASEEATLKKATVDHDASCRNAIAAYLAAVAICALTPPPFNIGCLYGATSAYAGAMAAAETNYQADIANAAIDRTNCDTEWGIELEKCLTKADDAYDTCVKLATINYDACKAKCAGAGGGPT